MNTQTQAANQQTGRRRKLSGLLIALVIVAGIAVFALAAAGVGYYILASRYDKAVEAVDAGDPARAIEIVSELPPWFEDATDLMVYAQGKLALQNGDYLNARAFFTQLGGFQDSAEMILETDYQNATVMLDAKKYDEATALFERLAGQNYKDSEIMVQEVDYRRALDLLTQEKWGDAINVFAALGDYSDSADKLLQAGRSVLDLAVKKYRTRIFADASKLLDQVAAVSALEKDVALYRTLIEAHNMNLFIGLTDYDKAKPIFDKLTTMDGMEDSRALMFSDPFLFYYLEGKWKDNDGKLDMNIYFDRNIHRWYVTKTLVDTEERTLKDSCIYIYGYPNFRFGINTDGTITVQPLYRDGTIHTTIIAYRVPS